MKTVTIEWDQAAERFLAEGSHRGHPVAVNAPKLLPRGEGRHGPSGFSASELLLASVGSCAAWDLVEILRKQRQDVRGIQVVVEGDQDADAPWAYHTLIVRFTVQGRSLDAGLVEKAVDLSVHKYCSVVATIRGVANVSSRLILEDVDVLGGGTRSTAEATVASRAQG